MTFIVNLMHIHYYSLFCISYYIIKIHVHYTNTQQSFRFDGKLTINEIVKAGSMGHGTTVFGDFDVDLVIYSDGNNYIVYMLFVHYTSATR